MTDWVSEHRSSITFTLAALAGMLLIVGGFFTGQESSILLGAGVLGLPGFAKAVSPSEA